jgi:hypothetical protein
MSHKPTPLLTLLTEFCMLHLQLGVVCSVLCPVSPSPAQPHLHLQRRHLVGHRCRLSPGLGYSNLQGWGAPLLHTFP